LKATANPVDQSNNQLLLKAIQAWICLKENALFILVEPQNNNDILDNGSGFAEGKRAF